MNEKAWLKMALKDLFKTPIGEQGSVVQPQPLEQTAEDFGCGLDHRLASETEMGGPNELVIDTKGRYPAVIKPWVIWQFSVWSDYHARQHKGLPQALGLISSLRALYRALVGDWKVQTLTAKSADRPDSSSRLGSLKLTCCSSKANQAEDYLLFWECHT